MNNTVKKVEFDHSTVKSTADLVLCTALDIGEHLLKNGAEVSRVEDTIERICFAYGAAYVESFAITNLIAASVRMKDGEYCEQMRHVETSSINLFRIEQLNKISREICEKTIDLETARAKIAANKRKTPYPEFVRIIAQAVFVAGFTAFFGGSLLDAVASGVVAIIVILFGKINAGFNKGLLKTATSSFLAGALSVLSVYIGFGHNLEIIVIGTIMMLIPGLSLGTAIFDMFNGNLISGAIRFLQSLITTIVIALGYAAALWLLM